MYTKLHYVLGCFEARAGAGNKLNYELVSLFGTASALRSNSLNPWSLLIAQRTQKRFNFPTKLCSHTLGSHLVLSLVLSTRTRTIKHIKVFQAPTRWQLCSKDLPLFSAVRLNNSGPLYRRFAGSGRCQWLLASLFQDCSWFKLVRVWFQAWFLLLVSGLVAAIGFRPVSAVDFRPALAAVSVPRAADGGCGCV